MTEEGGPTERPRRALRWGALAVVVAGVVVFVLLGANRPADPSLGSLAGPSRVPGFGEISYRIEPGGPGERCALLADTPQQQQRGLMDRSDLGGYDGMLFRFSKDTTVEFWMKDTTLPLSIAWFDADGRFVSATDMEPCPDQVKCPTYGAARPYRYALEVERGGLGALGIGPGATLAVGGPCG